MRRDLKVLGCLLAGIALSPAAKALVPSQPNDHYQAIPDRNLFGLKPAQQPTNEPPPLQLPKILLTGITTILGDKRALMKTQPVAGKPGDPAKEQSFILTEGQREGGIEVLTINEIAGSVKVNNSGTIMTLTFEKDGAKLPNSATNPAAPPGMPTPAMASSLGSQRPYPSPLPGNGDTRLRGFPSRNLRLPSSSGAVSPPASAATAPGTADSSAPPSTGTPAASVPAQALPSGLTAEEQTILLELQRQANQQNPNFPPLPQTAITPGTSVVGPQNTPTVPQQVLPQ